MAEKYLLKNHGNIKTLIWRPSIIACALKDPFPAWTDSISAAGGLCILWLMGAMPFMYTETGENALDMIPVDVVTNGLLVATSHSAQAKQMLHIYNSATSAENPLSFNKFKGIGLYRARYFHLNKRMFKDDLYFKFIHTKWEYDMRIKLQMKLPLKALNVAANTPVVGTKNLKKQAEKMNKLAKKGEGLNDLYAFFIDGNWKFENKKITKLIDMLSPEEKVEFGCDIRNLDWDKFVLYYAHGMAIWCLNED